MSLDLFRGLTVFVMIVVNTPGPGAVPYPQLVHAPWIGFTLADLVFPTFLFAVGNALHFAMRSEMANAQFAARVLKRGALIFLLGVLLSWYPFVAEGDAGWAFKPLATLRIPGVLQRIALCYVIAAMIARWCRPRTIVLIAAGLLLSYWAVLTGFSAADDAYAKSTNVGTRLDIWLLGAGHLYERQTGFDPEGLLGTFPAIVNVLGGYLVGGFVAHAGKQRATVVRLGALGLGVVGLGLAWGLVFPIAKSLWTSSFVLLSVGIDMIVLAGFVWLYEVRGIRVGRGFLGVLGRNPLAIYLFSEVLIMTLLLVPTGGSADLYEWVGVAVFQTIAPGAAGSLLCAVAYTMLCWGVGWVMDRKGWYLRV